MVASAFGRRESLMAHLSLATERPAIVVSPKGNVLPFDARRRSSRIGETSSLRPDAREGIVVRLPLPNRQSRRSEASSFNAKAISSDGDEQRFTAFDYVATAFVILSVFAAPALVWALLRSASFG
jgi:hypothetical protein